MYLEIKPEEGTFKEMSSQLQILVGHVEFMQIGVGV